MPQSTYQIACVSFLNSKPLIDPLLDNANIHVHFAVPSQLMALIESKTVSAALLSAVDYQLCRDDLLLVPAGMIGCDSPTPYRSHLLPRSPSTTSKPSTPTPTVIPA